MKFLIPLILIALVGCTSTTATQFSAGVVPAPASDAPSPATPTACTAAIRSDLETASTGLLLTSESDYPWQWWEVSQDFSDLPTATEFLSLIGSSGQPIEERDFDQYFAFASTIRPDMTPEEKAIAEQYQAFIATLKANYTDLVVYKVGLIQVDVYVVGVGSCSLSGMKSLAIET